MEIPTVNKYTLHADSCTNQENQHQNPIERYRQPENSLYIFVFPVIVIVWMIICILGFSAPQIHDGGRADEILTNFQWYLNAPLHRLSVLAILPFIITSAIVWICANVIEKYTKRIMNFILASFLLVTIVSDYKAIIGVLYILEAIRHGNVFYLCFIIVYVICSWIAAIYITTCCFCFFKVDKTILCDLTKDSLRAILHSPSIIFFMCLITALTALVTLFTLNALLFHRFAHHSEFQFIFYAITTLLGGLFVASFFIALAIMVVTEFAINYYWKNNEAPYPRPFHFSIVNALRNHCGTIMLASTIFISQICGIVQAFKHKRLRNNRENNFIHFVTKVYLAVRMPEIALIFTSIYGYGFIKSSKTAFDLVLRSPSLFLATLAAWEAVLCIPLAFMAIGSTIVLFIAVGVTDMTSDEDHKNVALLIHGMIYPFATYALLLWFTMKALVVNKIVMLNKEDQYNEGKTQTVNYA